MNQVIQERIAALTKVMEQAGVDYYMVPTADFHNSEYVDRYFKVREIFPGFTGSNGTLVVSQKEAGLWTDGRYFIQAENELSGTGIQTVPHAGRRGSHHSGVSAGEHERGPDPGL